MKWPQQMDRPLSPEEAELLANLPQNPIQLELMPYRIPVRGTQLYEILMYLQTGGRLTVAKALRDLSVYALSQRIGELRRFYGWPIKSELIKVGPKTYVAEYSL